MRLTQPAKVTEPTSRGSEACSLGHGSRSAPRDKSWLSAPGPCRQAQTRLARGPSVLAAFSPFCRQQNSFLFFSPKQNLI